MPFSTVPFVFSPNTLIQSAQVNADFASLVTAGNNIDASQITTGILPVANGGTGSSTAAGAATSIGAVQKSGDVMTGPLVVPSIFYTGSGHYFSFGWDGTYAHVIVDGVDTGIIGDITGVTAGNGLTGGGSSGAISLAMSGSYSGNLSVSGQMTANGYQCRAGIGGATTGNQFNIEWGTGATGAHLWIDNVLQGQIALQSSLGNYLPLSGGTIAGSLSVTNNVTMSQQLTVASGLTTLLDLNVNDALQCWFGIVYRGINPAFLQIGFNYSSPNLDLWVNDGYAFSIIPASSDARLKSNIARSEIDALGVISQMKLSAYDREDRPNQHFNLGLVAQDVEALIPEAVVAGPDDARAPIPHLLHLDYNPLLAYTIRAVQQLTARVEELEAALALKK